MIIGRKKRNLAIAMALLTTLTLSGCFGVDKEVEKETAISSEEGTKPVSKAEERAIELANEEFAEKAWKELSAEERLLVNGEPTLLNETRDDSKEFKEALALATKSKEQLRIIYFETKNEENSGKLFVYGVGDKFVSKTERVPMTFVSKKEMELYLIETKTIEELEEKLEKEKKWNSPVFTYQYASKDGEKDVDAVADLVFYEMGKSFYAVAHKKGTILHDDKEAGNWTKEMLQERFGDVLPSITEG